MSDLRRALVLYILVTSIIAIIVLLIPKQGPVGPQSEEGLRNRISTSSRAVKPK